MSNIKQSLDARLAAGEISIEEYQKTLVLLEKHAEIEQAPPPIAQSAVAAGAGVIPRGFSYLPMFFAILVVSRLYWSAQWGVTFYTLQGEMEQMLEVPQLSADYVISLVMGVVYGILLLVYIFKLWNGLNRAAPEPTDISAGKAVGFLFIPLFNIYWMFVVYAGFCNRLNARLDQTEGHRKLKLPFNVGLFACLSSILGGILWQGLILLQIEWQVEWPLQKLLQNINMVVFAVMTLAPLLFVLMTGRTLDMYMKASNEGV